MREGDREGDREREGGRRRDGRKKVGEREPHRKESEFPAEGITQIQPMSLLAKRENFFSSQFMNSYFRPDLF